MELLFPNVRRTHCIRRRSFLEHRWFRLQWQTSRAWTKWGAKSIRPSLVISSQFLLTIIHHLFLVDYSSHTFFTYHYRINHGSSSTSTYSSIPHGSARVATSGTSTIVNRSSVPLFSGVVHKSKPTTIKYSIDWLSKKDDPVLLKYITSNDTHHTIMTAGQCTVPTATYR